MQANSPSVSQRVPCVLYLRYSRPFDYFIHPMPANKK